MGTFVTVSVLLAMIVSGVIVIQHGTARGSPPAPRRIAEPPPPVGLSRTAAGEERSVPSALSMVVRCRLTPGRRGGRWRSRAIRSAGASHRPS